MESIYLLKTTGTQLLTTSNSKTIKGEKFLYLTGILYLKPYNSGGGKNLCAAATPGCIAGCLNTAGRAAMSYTDKKTGLLRNIVLEGRQRKTDFYNNEMPLFIETLDADIKKLKRRAERKGVKLAIRINGTSDLPSLARTMAKRNPDVQFYDYTKLPNPQKRVLPNYYLTFSKAENNWAECVEALENGVNVSVVFDKVPKKQYKGYKVIDGDETDLRFLDNKRKRMSKGYIVGLKAKGQAKKDVSGFVVRTQGVK